MLTCGRRVCSKVLLAFEQRKFVSFHSAANSGKHKPPVKIFLKFLTAIASVVVVVDET